MLKRVLLSLGRMRAGLVCLLGLGVLLFGVVLAPYYLRYSLESFQPLDLKVGTPKPLVDFTAASNAIIPDSGQTRLDLHPGTTNPLASRVLLVVVNNLGQDDLVNLPALQNLKDVSTGSYLFTEPIAAATPGLVPLLTGADSSLSGGFTLLPSEAGPTSPPAADQLAHLDNLLASAHRDRQTTALFASHTWLEAMQPAWLDLNLTFDPNQPATDVADQAVNFLQKKGANLTIVQLSSVAQAQAQFGNNAPQVLEARQKLDAALARLTDNKTVDLARTTVIITGDWDSSTRAGDRWSVPLLLVGQAVQPGERSWGQQTDVAPTIAALLGIEYPRNNQGRVLTSALAMNPQDLAEKMLTLVEQRQALDNAYRQHLGLGLPLAVNNGVAIEASKNVTAAIDDYKLGNFNNIEAVVDPVLRYTQQDMSDAREEWFGQARGQRTILAIAMLVLPLLLLLVWRSRLSLITLVAAALGSGLPYLIYWAQGKRFAFNSMGLTALRDEALWRSGIALVVGSILMGLWFDWAERHRRNRWTKGRVDLAFQMMAELRKPLFPFPRILAACVMLTGWLLFFSAFIWFVWYYWRFGFFGPLAPTQPPVVPDALPNFLQFFALDNTLGLLIWLPLAPLVMSAVFAFKRKIWGDGNPNEEEETIHIEQEYVLRPGAETGIVKI